MDGKAKTFFGDVTVTLADSTGVRGQERLCRRHKFRSDHRGSEFKVDEVYLQGGKRCATFGADRKKYVLEKKERDPFYFSPIIEIHYPPKQATL